MLIIFPETFENTITILYLGFLPAIETCRGRRNKENYSQQLCYFCKLINQSCTCGISDSLTHFKHHKNRKADKAETKQQNDFKNCYKPHAL